MYPKYYFWKKIHREKMPSLKLGKKNCFKFKKKSCHNITLQKHTIGYVWGWSVTWSLDHDHPPRRKKFLKRKIEMHINFNIIEDAYSKTDDIKRGRAQKSPLKGWLCFFLQNMPCGVKTTTARMQDLSECIDDALSP